MLLMERCTACSVAKANSLKLRQIFLYLVAQIYGRNISCLVDTEASHSFMSSKLVKELDLPTCRTGKSMDVWFAKSEPHVTFKCGTFQFVKSFTLHKMNEVDLILEDTFFDTHTVDTRHKPVGLWYVMMTKR